MSLESSIQPIITTESEEQENNEKSLTDIRNVRLRKEKKRDEFTQNWNIVSENLPSEIRVDFIDIINNTQQLEYDSTVNEYIKKHPEHVSELQKLETLFHKRRALEVELDELRNREKAEMISSFEEIYEQAVLGLDIESLLISTNEDYYMGDTVSELIKTLSAMEDFKAQIESGTVSDLGFWYIEQEFNKISDASKSWDREGVLDKSVKRKERIERPDAARFTRFDMNVASKRIRNFQKVANPYRPTIHHSHNLIPVCLEALDADFGTDAYTQEHGNGRELYLKLMTHLRRVHNKEMTDFKEAGGMPMTSEEALAFAKKRAESTGPDVFDDLNIQFEDPPEGHYSLVSDSSIRKGLAKNIPPYFASNILSMNYRIWREGNPGGDCATETNNLGQWVASRIRIFSRWYAEKSLKSPIAKKYLENDIIYIPTHEIAHRVHNELTLNEILEWERIMHNDNTAVTWYVEQNRQKDPEVAGKIEDFTESFGLFCTHPHWLKELSIERYNFMRAFFDKYVPDDQKKEFFKKHDNRILTFAAWVRRTRTSSKQLKERWLG